MELWKMFPVFLRRFTRLQRIMAMLVAVAVVLSVLFGTIFAYLNRQNIYQAVGMEMEYDVNRILTYMEGQMENMESIFDELLNDSYLQKYTTGIFATDVYDLVDFNKRLQSMVSRNSFLDTIDVYVERTGVLFTSDQGPTSHIDSRTKQYLQSYMESANGLQVTKEYRQHLYFWLTRAKDHVTFTFPIYDLYRGSVKTVGLAAISVRESSILNLLGGDDGRCRVLLDDHTVFLTNGAGQGVLPQLGETFEASLSLDAKVHQLSLYGEKQLVVATSMNNTGWTLVVMVPLSQLTSLGDSLGSYAILLIILNVVLLLVAEMVIIRYLARRIQPLMSMMENLKQGDFQTEIPGDEKDEFSYLFDAFRSMQQRIQQQFNEIYHLSLLQKEANLKLMHAQINPHFIYNIFYNMNWLIQLKKYDKLEDMVEAVAVFFKKSLNNGQPFILIRDEMKMLESYIAIQHIRFGDRFQAKVEIQPEILDTPILTHLLQPIVENAIRHGVEPLPQPGQVWIRGYFQQEQLIFEIEDNGVGMDEQTLCQIRQTLKKAQTDTGDFFALNNVHQRIQILYGESYGLRIESQPQQGTRVQIVLPKTLPQNSISSGMGWR